MKIALIVAMDKELKLILNLMDEPVCREIEGVKIYKGRIGKHEILAAKCGIGKVNSALSTFKIIKAESPELVINSGVAGGSGNGLAIGDVLVADNVAYHDVWCGPGTKYGAADGMDVMMKPSLKVLDLLKDLQDEGISTGLICSGDKFISDASEVEFIKSKFPDVKAVDMESASIAQTCLLNNIDFAIVRVVSDTPGEGENVAQYKNFWDKAPEKTFRTVASIIEKL